MKILTAHAASDYSEIAREASAVLKAGGVILYPTDTIYGLGVDALSDEAVNKLYALKGRKEDKPIHAMVERVGDFSHFAVVPKEAQILAEHFLPGPLSLVLEKHAHLTTGITKDLSTIGLRVPNHPLCMALCAAFPNPITATSANVSGLETVPTVAAILEQFGERSRYIDLVIDAGVLPPSLPSTVVAVGKESVRILRQGALTETDVWKVLNSDVASWTSRT